MAEKNVFVNFLKDIKFFILNILFPVECLGCGKENDWLCSKCLDGFEYRVEDRCVVCKQKVHFGKTHDECRSETSLDGVIIACESGDKLLQNVIRKFKYNFIQDLHVGLSRVFINKIILSKQQGNMFLLAGGFVVAPVPLHKKRLRWRGFNQAELLASSVSNFFDWQVRTDLIVRRKYTKPQVGLKKKKRVKSIQNIFDVDEFVSGDVLLIDDILTTSATLGECARVLKKKGAHRVWAMVLARG